jgi:hypothetical protein
MEVEKIGERESCCAAIEVVLLRWLVLLLGFCDLGKVDVTPRCLSPIRQWV